MNEEAQAIDEYIKHGWSLVPIPPGTKGPRHVGWNQRSAALKDIAQLPAGYGVGIAHAYSGTMAFDIDSWELTEGYGINIKALYEAADAVTIESGRAGRGKLLYRMPFGLILPSKKIAVDNKTAFELRCGTADGITVQDILPPSVHPETFQPYRWGGQGHWSNLPTIPQSLLDLWNDLLAKDDIKVNVDGVDASWKEIEGALGFIDPSGPREQWVHVGMALHWAGSQTFNPQQGLVLWNNWSKKSETKYPGERHIINQWNSFRSDKNSTVTLGTLFHYARENGWVRPTPDASDLFGSVQITSPSELFQNLRPVPPEVDVSLWPSILVKRANEVSESVGCDPLVPLFAGLAAVCGVIDAQSRLELMPGFKVPPVLWLMTLGDPADKKSPGSRPMFAPLAKIEMEDRPRYQKDLLDWEGREAAYSTAKKAYIDFCASPESLLGDEAPIVPEIPTPPVPLKITVSDITSQKLIRQSADRPRGLLCQLDEMNSWIRKLTDKSSGEDRSAWVVSYEAERYEMDRVGAGSIHAENLAVSIYGNIQPRVYRESMAALSADGLLQRFVPGILNHSKTRLGQPIPDYLTSASAWENTLRLIFALPPMTYKLSQQAFETYRNFQSWYEDAKQEERLLQAGDTYMTAFGKLEGLVGRIALIFHVIENPFSTVISEDIMGRVIALVRGYIIPAYRFTLGEIDATSSFDMWLSEYIIQHCDQPKITLSDIKRGARRPLEHIVNTHAASQTVLLAMYTLEQAHWVARIDDGTKEHIHVAEWLINPALKEMFKAHRQKVIQAKQKRMTEIWSSRGSWSPEPNVYGRDALTNG